tara:strand:+ start:239 stop:1219 length:981 start_codon:yes stop_codon:yes gene_type:complete
MNLLVTGGAGYIGSHVVLEAIDCGFNVTVFDDLSTGSKLNLDDRVQFFKGSTLSNSDLSKLFNAKEFDAIVHLAASKAAGESMLYPQKYSTNNIIGSLNLLNMCTKHKISAFVFSSSAAVYGYPQSELINEDHPLLPINYYGHTKLQIEENLKWFANLCGFKYASLRYFNAAGYDLNGKVRRLENNPQNLIPIVMESTIGIRSKIEVYGGDYNTRDGTGVRDYIHVSDLAKGHLDSINYILQNNESLTINLGTEAGYSVLDIINKTSEISNQKICYDIVDRRDGDPDTVVANAKLAKQLIGWEPKFSDLNTIINSTWEIYKSQSFH